MKSFQFDTSVISYSTCTNDYKKLEPAQVETLLDISKQVAFRDSSSVRRRMGVNGANALSVYNVSKWYFFGHQLRAQYKAQFPKEKIDKAFTGWYLHIPVNGFIDKIATWVDKTTQNMHYFSVALHDNQQIYIDDELHTFNKGDVCWFNIKSTYEIKTTATEQLWACILVAEY